MGPVNGRRLTLLLPLILAACSGGGDEPVAAKRVSLDETRQPGDPLPSPDTKQASWTVAPNGQAINFGLSADKPMLTLACQVRANPPQLRVIRHVVARPNEKALFPVIGNGRISRFKVDATLHDGEWRWEGALPATDPLVEVFTGSGELEATLPGGGSLLIERSRIPAEFVNWCRAGGQTQRPEGAEAAEDAEQAKEARAAARRPAAPPAR